jgi:uncharacterized repeat protein (TIGR01451 family)
MKNPSKSKILHLAGKMKIQTIPITSRAKSRMRSLTASTRFGAIFVLILAAAFYTATSASLARKSYRAGLPSSASKSQTAKQAATGRNQKAGLLAGTHNAGLTNLGGLFAALMPQTAPGVESIDTFAADCTTPKDVFNLGDTVCAKVVNAPLRNPSPLRRINWTTTNGVVTSTQEVEADPQTSLFVIPASGTTVIDGETIDNRGTWSASINSTADSSTRAIAYFSVKDPQNAAADLVIYSFSADSDTPVQPGQNTSFILWVSNNGPDAAQNVHVTQATPPGMTFVSASQMMGPTPGFTCTNAGTTDCELASLAKGVTAVISVTYTAGSSSLVSSGQATISSDTTDPRPNSNSSDAQVEVRTPGGAAATCSLDCPGNITATANATQNGQPGAFVTFTGNVEASGDCGATSTSVPSGSFFPVGTSTVSVTSAQGGGACSFTVTVVDSAPPTIECPANMGVTAPDGDCDATVNPGTPTASAGATVHGERSDGQDVSAPYPAGITTITWIAIDSDGRKTSCQQTITVTTNDTTPPTLEAPPDVTISTPATSSGSCGLVVGETELGTPTASDNCTVNVSRTGVPSGNFFPVGKTTITYTAKDGAGNTVTDTQDVTVIEASAPTIIAPEDASYTCLSEVPAADASQAHGDDQTLPNGGPPSDNCGTPTVTVTETRSGAGSASSPLVILRTFTATDASGNSASDVQTITVIDSTPPTVTAPADVVINTGAGATSCGITIADLDAALGAGSASDNCAGATVSRSGVPAGNNFPVGETTITYIATDAAGNTASADQKVTVVDTTAPTITAPADKTLYTGAGATSCDVTVSDLNATLGTPTANDNCPGVTWSRSGGNVFPLGDTFVTYTATDAHGNTAAPVTQKVTVVDNTPPVVTPPANITVQLPLNSSATSMAVSYPNPATATDNCAGAITFSYSPASGSTFNVGPTTVTVTATDAHGNSGTATFTVTVLYNFTGFFSPIGNLPTLNVVNAGKAVPVKFSLSGNKGLGIFAVNNPYSTTINCSTTDPAADVTETLTAGGSSLSYSPDQYNYVWKTESSWAGTCRQLTVTLNDGSVHKANFKFK